MFYAINSRTDDYDQIADSLFIVLALVVLLLEVLSGGTWVHHGQELHELLLVLAEAGAHGLSRHVGEGSWQHTHQGIGLHHWHLIGLGSTIDTCSTCFVCSSGTISSSILLHHLLLQCNVHVSSLELLVELLVNCHLLEIVRFLRLKLSHICVFVKWQCCTWHSHHHWILTKTGHQRIHHELVLNLLSLLSSSCFLFFLCSFSQLFLFLLLLLFFKFLFFLFFFELSSFFSGLGCCLIFFKFSLVFSLLLLLSKSQSLSFSFLLFLLLLHLIIYVILMLLGCLSQELTVVIFTLLSSVLFIIIIGILFLVDFFIIVLTIIVLWFNL